MGYQNVIVWGPNMGTITSPVPDGHVQTCSRRPWKFNAREQPWTEYSIMTWTTCGPLARSVMSHGFIWTTPVSHGLGLQSEIDWQVVRTSPSSLGPGVVGD